MRQPQYDDPSSPFKSCFICGLWRILHGLARWHHRFERWQ